MSDGVQILSSVPESLLTTATVQDISPGGELVTSGTPIEIIHTSPETIAALLPKNGQAICQDAETSIAHSGGKGFFSILSRSDFILSNNLLYISTFQ